MTFEMITHVDDFENVWPQAKELLSKGFIGRGEVYTVDDFYQPLLQGQMQLWIVSQETITGAVLTGIEAGPEKRRLDIILLGGQDLPSWVQDMNEALTQFANDNNCIAIQAITRPGFSRFVPEFVQDSHVYVKALNG